MQVKASAKQAEKLRKDSGKDGGFAFIGLTLCQEGPPHLRSFHSAHHTLVS